MHRQKGSKRDIRVILNAVEGGGWGGVGGQGGGGGGGVAGKKKVNARQALVTRNYEKRLWHPTREGILENIYSRRASNKQIVERSKGWQKRKIHQGNGKGAITSF